MRHVVELVLAKRVKVQERVSHFEEEMTQSKASVRGAT